jgi:hypothetical protein
MIGSPPAAAAVEICGTVWSGSRPVAGVQVLASAEGVLATSDSTGSFCLSGLDGSLQKIQVLALGFHPAELWAHAESTDKPLRVELVPLRTIQFGQLGQAVNSEPSGGENPAPISVPPDPDLEQRAEAALSSGAEPDPPFLVLPSDSLWVQTTPEGKEWRSLRLLSEVLMTGPPVRDSSRAARYWLDVSEWARSLRERCCSGDPGCEFSSGECAYLDRAITISLGRLYLWGDGSGTLELSRRLSGLREADDPLLRQWGEVLSERFHLTP